MSRRVLCIMMALTMAVSGCATTGTTPTEEGTAPGPGLGDIVGSILGKIKGKGTEEAAAGAASAAPVGSVVDQQERELVQRFAQADGVSVQRLQDILAITFKSDSFFDVEASQIKPDSSGDLEYVADLLRKYPETRVEISGYTDSSGSEKQNLALSEQRAQAVAELLAQKGVDPPRIAYRGYGEANFVASNATENGRQLNRRITLVIIPPGVRSHREGPVPKSVVPTLSMNLSFPG